MRWASCCRLRSRPASATTMPQTGGHERPRRGRWPAGPVRCCRPGWLVMIRRRMPSRKLVLRRGARHRCILGARAQRTRREVCTHHAGDVTAARDRMATRELHQRLDRRQVLVKRSRPLRTRCRTPTRASRAQAHPCRGPAGTAPTGGSRRRGDLLEHEVAVAGPGDPRAVASSSAARERARRSACVRRRWLRWAVCSSMVVRVPAAASAEEFEGWDEQRVDGADRSRGTDPMALLLPYRRPWTGLDQGAAPERLEMVVRLPWGCAADVDPADVSAPTKRYCFGLTSRTGAPWSGSSGRRRGAVR